MYPRVQQDPSVGIRFSGVEVAVMLDSGFPSVSGEALPFNIVRGVHEKLDIELVASPFNAVSQLAWQCWLNPFVGHQKQLP